MQSWHNAEHTLFPCSARSVRNDCCNRVARWIAWSWSCVQPQTGWRAEANDYDQANEERWTKLQHVDDGAPHVNAPPSGLSWADVLSHDKWVGMSDGELIRHLEIEGFVVLPNVLNTTTVAAVRAQALVLFRLARARECYRI